MNSFCIILISFFSFAAFAASAPVAEESGYTELARTRRYVGGNDESDLKVQPVLYQTASSKKNNLAHACTYRINGHNHGP